MKRNKIFLLVLALVLVLSGCASQSKGSMYEASYPPSASMDVSNSAGMGSWGLSYGSDGGSYDDYYVEESYDYDYDYPTEEKAVEGVEHTEQKKIKRGSISVEVEDIAVAYESIKTMVGTNEGYIHSLREYSTNRESSMTMILKVKANNFETVYDNIKGAGKVREANMSSEDVTREYIDTKARLETLKVQEESLKNIMAKADKVEDLLRVESELQRIRQQIESSQGNLNYLDSAINYSELSVSISMVKEPVKVSEDMSIIEEIIFNIKDGLGHWGNVLLDFIYNILWNLPVILVLVVIFIIFKKKRINLRKKIKSILKKDKDNDK